MSFNQVFFKWQKFMLLRKENFKLVIKWQVDTVTKGIVSNVVPIEDMPFLPDGTPVDIISKSTRCTFKDEPWSAL